MDNRNDQNSKLSQQQLREHFKQNKPLSLEEALSLAQKRRETFERVNSEYIETKLQKVIEPMIINLLNQQPEDVQQGMKLWLLTQFNTIYTDDQTYYNDFQLDLGNWSQLPDFERRKEIKRMQIPKTKIDELRQEIQELKQLKKDMHNADHSKMNLSKTDSGPGYELQLEDILSESYVHSPPDVNLKMAKASTEMPKKSNLDLPKSATISPKMSNENVTARQETDGQKEEIVDTFSNIEIEINNV